MSKGLKIGLIVLLVIGLVVAMYFFNKYLKDKKFEEEAAQMVAEQNALGLPMWKETTVLPNTATDLAARKLRAANGANAI